MQQTPVVRRLRSSPALAVVFGLSLLQALSSLLFMEHSSMAGSLSVRSLTPVPGTNSFLSGPSRVLAGYGDYVYGKWSHLEEVALIPWKTAGSSCAPCGMDLGFMAALLGSLQIWAKGQAAWVSVVAGFVTLCKFSLLSLLVIQSTLCASYDVDS